MTATAVSFDDRRTDCCGADFLPNSDICAECKEHAVEQLPEDTREPETYEEWIAEAQAIAVDLADAKRELQASISAKRAGRPTHTSKQYCKLCREVDELKADHQRALVKAGQMRRSMTPVVTRTDDPFLSALKQAAKELLTGEEYQRLITRAVQIAGAST